MERIEIFQNLGVALALGLLIGLERGWKRRDEAEGARFAGIRTFALIGLMGAVMATLGRVADIWVLAASILAFTFLMIGGMLRPVMKDTEDHSVTGYVAMFMTLLVGALAGYGYLAVAAATAVVATVLLGVKAPLHRWLRHLDQAEISALLQLLLISVVVLPLLPNRGFGPWGALNPYEIWLMVVVVSVISFAGFLAIKWAGARKGALLTAIFGGLASSTAIAISFARFGRDNPALARLLAAGVGISSTIMFVRMLAVVTVFSKTLALALLPTFGLVALGGAVGVFALWRLGRGAAQSSPTLENSFDLGVPIRFGLLLGLVMVVADGAEALLGTHGVYLVAAFAGITDVDAITLSLAGDVSTGLLVEVATTAVLIAALVNTLVKGIIVAASGGLAMGRLAAIPFGLMIVAGGAGYLYFSP